MSASAHGEFVIAAMDLDGVRVGRKDGRLIAHRDLTDDEVSLEDVLDLAREHGLVDVDVEVDIPNAEVRVRLEERDD